MVDVCVVGPVIVVENIGYVVEYTVAFLIWVDKATIPTSKMIFTISGFRFIAMKL